ncbi:regulatory LuxR family protein [Rhizobium sp. PP-F2F-G38]|uniref:LuxR family transcriptional regulator n=1 Tax=Ferranicluibacter rubi TaxID=2715133 RepID=A0AA44CC90_9HYPH|nr:LuxR C-terminal-related transcriptional regulator [Ferranicluibacter rubi]PYE32585.1 regulatory LuxR family protein [Rhizobium sp. PP-WC-1G-195]PYE96014.1 regulatory LuxR family protein [Rhizobium sp. PP-F2F-G38]TCP88381.1 regulatory LuxR family protein [Rhizobium sp. PP-CC-2G-626]TCQ22954.1 regulatory LuxR family protein [Rhizobium sp. PP-CC-3G-465]NHT75737.1 LuxR family transcriptional regulator [Ferranicluibacter rubi]
MGALIDRPELIAGILGARTPIVILDAPAGMGKSSVLALIAQRMGADVVRSPQPPTYPADGSTTDTVLRLWDIPPYTAPLAIPESCVSGNHRLIIAKRPDTVLPGQARALAYGQATLIGSEGLMMSHGELERLFGSACEDVAEKSGGWPLAVFNTRLFEGPPDVLRAFLDAEVLATMPDEELVVLQLMLVETVGRTSAATRHPSFSESHFPTTSPLPLTAPFLMRPDGTGRPTLVVAGVRDVLREAIDHVMERRLRNAGSAKAIAEAYRAKGLVVEAICAFQKAGLFDNALRIFQDAGGPFFLYYFGPQAFDTVLAGFPLTFSIQTEVLVLAKALQSLKLGDIARARRLLIDRFGDIANDYTQVFSSRSVFSRQFRAFRLVMLLYEDYFFSEELLERAYALIAEFPVEDHLSRGSFYNSVLEFYIRNRQFAAAEEVAQRAMFHYRAAQAPLLAFYISLHQTLIRLMMGDALAARRYATQSAAFIAELPFESPNDARLQVLMDACVEYEAGRAEPLARFLNLEIDGFAHGEIWPSLLEFALHYGSQALGEHFSTMAARSFLDRWRVYQTSNGQFQAMISIREAAVLQNANRWQEAADTLVAISGRVDRAFVLAGGEPLARVQERDELALALIWLRQLVYEAPQRPGLDQLVTTIIGNMNLTDRQRMSAEIWLAYVAKRQRNATQARAVLQKTFGDCARLGTIAPLAEERVFLQELIDNQRIGGFLSTVTGNRQILRKLRDSGRLDNQSTKMANTLSRRESKILLMISEGAANKDVANTLGLSEATVKFHLGNVYRKLGCRSRQEAISSARALGLLG